MTNIPDRLVCDITVKLFNYPVHTRYGDIFERSAIEEWINRNGTCPMTRNVLTINDLGPSLLMRQLVEEWRTNESHNPVSNEEKESHSEQRVSSSNIPNVLTDINDIVSVSIFSGQGNLVNSNTGDTAVFRIVYKGIFNNGCFVDGIETKYRTDGTETSQRITNSADEPQSKKRRVS